LITTLLLRYCGEAESRDAVRKEEKGKDREWLSGKGTIILSSDHTRPCWVMNCGIIPRYRDTCIVKERMDGEL
jgi:hypothetical protein